MLARGDPWILNNFLNPYCPQSLTVWDHALQILEEAKFCPGLSCKAGSLLSPRGCVPGRDSAACQAQHSACLGSCPGRCGETCGGKEPPGRAGAFCWQSCCLGQGTYSLWFSRAKLLCFALSLSPSDFTAEIGQCLSASVRAFLSHWFLFLLLCLSRNRYKCCDFREVEMA